MLAEPSIAMFAYARFHFIEIRQTEVVLRLPTGSVVLFFYHNAT